METKAKQSSKVWGEYAAELVMSAYHRASIDEESGNLTISCQNFFLSKEANELVNVYNATFCEQKKRHYGAIVKAIPLSLDKLKIDATAAITLQSMLSKFAVDVYALAAALHVISFPDVWHLPQHKIISVATISTAIHLHHQSFLNAEYLFTNKSDKTGLDEIVLKFNKDYARFLDALGKSSIDGQASRASVRRTMSNRDFTTADIDALALKAESEGKLSINRKTEKTIIYEVQAAAL